MITSNDNFLPVSRSLPAVISPLKPCVAFASTPPILWLKGLAAVWLALGVLRVSAQTTQVIYDDALENGWTSWGWATTINFANTSPVHSGSDSISVTCGSGYQALYLHATAFDSTPYTNLTFWINGGSSGGQPLQVQGTLGGTSQVAVVLAPLTANTWTQINVSLSALGVADQPNMDGFWIQSQSSSAIPTFYVDDISLQGGPAITNVAVSVAVDAQANRTPISPLIYGTAWATSNQLADLNFTMNRAGGNEETTDNWQINAHGKGADWYFENYADGDITTPGDSLDSFVANSKYGGAQPLITLSMVGWMPKLGSGRSVIWSYSQAKYGPQTGDDPYHTDAGNGVSVTNDTLITWNNPNDAYFPTNVLFEQGLVQHFLSKWGTSTNGGVSYYIMDNEHSIWFSTHQDIHPIGPTMHEIYTDIVATASMVKSNDPNALVCGPEEWGWNGYLYSGYDQQNSGSKDRGTNGGWDYMPWLLNQLHQHDTNTGQRLLDYFTLHCYPQEGDVSSGSDVSPATALLRNQTTRQFWDTNYVDPSWIGSVIGLIPLMKTWVATNYPGTRIGVTEYNWGAETNINGATAQADLLGIFGKYGLNLATRWTTPETGSPTYNAMKMYRNYDGNKSVFGDTSVSATGPDPDDVSVFAATRSSDGALTVMVVNKQLTESATTTLSISNFYASGSAQPWQLTSANTITNLSSINFTGNSFTSTLPAQSITLFVLPAGALPPAPSLAAGTVSRTNTFDFWLTGQSGLTYVVQASTNLVSWSPLQTNTLASNSVHLVVSTSANPYRFYRAQWVP
jgi:hypothetical protein